MDVVWGCSQKYEELTQDSDLRRRRSWPLTCGSVSLSADLRKRDFQRSAQSIQSRWMQFGTVQRACLLPRDAPPMIC